MRQSGEAVVSSIGIKPPLQALDLGCGDGTTAVPLARQGADVVGIDIARNLVEAGNRRAAEEGLNRLEFREGDACNLEGVGDHSFDLTLSVFGAMFAPRPMDVAKEMVRVTRPGGRIVMGNWIPNDTTSFVSQLLKISSSFMPPPPEGFVSPMTWGVDSHIIERFGQAGVPKENISMVQDTFHFESADKGPADVVERHYLHNESNKAPARWRNMHRGCPMPNGKRSCRPVGVIIHHVASVYPIEIHIAQEVAAGKALTGVTWAAVAEMNAKHAHEHNGVSRQDTIDLLRRNSQTAAEAVRTFTDEQLDSAAPVSLNADAPLTAQFLIEDHAVRHSWHHLAKIKAVLQASSASSASAN